MTRSFCARQTALAMLTLATGCLEPTIEDQESNGIAHRDEALFSKTPVTYWPTGDIPVCFKPGTNFTATNPDFLSFTAAARAILEAEYETIPNVHIDFTGWDICPATVPTSMVKFTLNNLSDGGGSASQGYRPIAGSSVQVSTRPLGHPWNMLIMHEFGHILGFHHEFDRADSGTNSACETNVVAIDDKADPPAPFVGLELTQYDPDSILSATYCHNAWTQPSQLDELGLEIVYYDGDGTQGIAVGSPFIVDNGMLLTSDRDVVVTKWTARGAMPDAYTGTVHWDVPGRAADYDGFAMPTSLLNPGANAVHAEFEDVRHRQHLATGTVTIDSKRHDALLYVASVE